MMLAVTYFHTDERRAEVKSDLLSISEMSGKDKPDKIVASDGIFRHDSWQTFSLWEATALL